MKRNIYIFIVLSLALALPSCKIGKKYALPELDLPELIAYGKQKGVDIILWTVFNVLDKQLEAACKKCFDRQHLLAEPVCRYDFAASDYHRSR